MVSAANWEMTTDFKDGNAHVLILRIDVSFTLMLIDLMPLPTVDILQGLRFCFAFARRTLAGVILILILHMLSTWLRPWD